MKLILVRHGETHWNTLNKLQSFTDNELNTNGHNQAKKTASKLKTIHIDKIISSPLIRAIQTAEPLAQKHSIEIEIDQRITERNYGELEGQNYLELVEFMKPIIKEGSFSKYNIEEPLDFKKRISEFWEELHEKYFGKTVVLVSHSGTFKMLLSIIQNESYEIMRKKIHKTNASISTIEFSEPNVISLLDIGYDKHLVD
ncbi:MAG: histidine phosphatase family protein [Nanoarchaeota archaeon]|nr:histidine phosphatase family protein [Nanoarchaeota archaeon]